jgi:hypothetical protein
MREFLRIFLLVLRHIFLILIGLASSLDGAARGLVEFSKLADFVELASARASQ